MIRKLFSIVAMVIGGLIAFGLFKYWVQPRISAAGAALSTPDCIFAVDVGAAGAGRVGFSADGEYLEVSSNQRHSIVDAETGREICDYTTGKQRATAFAFSQDAKRIAFADGSIIRVKTVDGKHVAEVNIQEDGKISPLGKLAFIPALNGVMASCKQGFCVYKLDGTRVTFFPAAGSVRGLDVAPDGKTIFIADATGKVLRMVAGDSANAISAQAHQTYLSKAKLNSDGTVLVTLGRDHESPGGDLDLKIWDAAKLTLRHKFLVGKGVTDFAVDRKGDTILVGKSSGEATAYCLETFEQKRQWKMGRGINTVGLSPSSDRVCFGLSKSITTVDRSTQENIITGVRETVRNKRRIPLYTIKGQSVSPGVVLMLDSRLEDGEAVED